MISSSSLFIVPFIYLFKSFLPSGIEAKYVNKSETYIYMQTHAQNELFKV